MLDNNYFILDKFYQDIYNYTCDYNNISNINTNNIDFIENSNTYTNIDLNNISSIIYILLIINIPIIITTFFVAKFVYLPMKESFDYFYNKNEELYDYDSYLFEYLDEYYELENKDLSDNFLKSLKYKYIKQETKKGEVLMNYDCKNKSFNYYCKKANMIPFNYLDVVSRIYVVKYDCKNLYIDNYENNNIFEEENIDDKNNDNNNNNTANNKSNSIFFSNKKKTSKKIDNYNANKYKYKGTIDFFIKKCKTKKYKINNLNVFDKENFLMNDFFINIIDNEYINFDSSLDIIDNYSSDNCDNSNSDTNSDSNSNR